MIKAVIIEDELELREVNRLLLQENFSDVQIVGEAGGVQEAIDLLTEKKPDIVLMDIELADGNCFQVLQGCKAYQFKPIFITAYNHHAIKAIKFNAIDYILKPVNEFEFCNAVQQAIDSLNSSIVEKQTENFRKQYEKNEKPQKLALRTAETIHLVSIDEILFCKSDNSYTTFYCKDKEEITVSKSLKDYAELLAEHKFLRPHQSYLVNMLFISKIDKADGGFIVMHDQTEIPISVRRKQMIFQELDRF